MPRRLRAVQLEGYLGKLKRSARLNIVAWNVRWFWVDPVSQQLLYYTTKSAKTPSGGVHLKDVTAVKKFEDNKFQVESPTRNFMLKCDDPEMLRRWVDGLRHYVSQMQLYMEEVNRARPRVSAPFSGSLSPQASQSARSRSSDGGGSPKQRLTDSRSSSRAGGDADGDVSGGGAAASPPASTGGGRLAASGSLGSELGSESADAGRARSGSADAEEEVPALSVDAARSDRRRDVDAGAGAGAEEGEGAGGRSRQPPRRHAGDGGRGAQDDEEDDGGGRRGAAATHLLRSNAGATPKRGGGGGPSHGTDRHGAAAGALGRQQQQQQQLEEEEEEDRDGDARPAAGVHWDLDELTEDSDDLGEPPLPAL